MISVVSRVDFWIANVSKYLTDTDDLRMATIVLALLLLVLILFLIIILYVKSIVSALKIDEESAVNKQRVKEQFSKDLAREEYEEEKANSKESETEDEEFEKKLEKELQEDLEKSRKERLHNLEREEKAKKEEQEKKLKEEKTKEEEQNAIAEKERELKENEQQQIQYNKDYGIDLDWRKGKLAEMEAEQDSILLPQNLQYQQSNKSLNELLGLIIDMLARGVDELKIAQTIIFRNQGQNSEDDIIQTISAIKDFVAMSLNNKFKNVKQKFNLPDEATALYHLSEGDTTYVLGLIEALMDDNIDRTTSMSSGAKRDALFMETSNEACTFGSLSAINDVRLATGAFELAIELVPQNVNAWGRVADMYKRAGSNKQAIWAYQNVLNIADEDINVGQVANANKMLSQFYYEQGNNLQAAKLYNDSKQYYDALGINRRLDRQEIEIVEIIENKHHEDLQDTIKKIFARNDLKQYSYA